MSVFLGIKFHIDMELTIFTLLPEFNRLETNKMWPGYLDVLEIKSFFKSLIAVLYCLKKKKEGIAPGDHVVFGTGHLQW